ncbi:MAG: ROK family protein, partial [Rhodocyclaceae bacterium]|nr:ROK family protein [Rhodocyclaceae bacterium]
DIEDELGAPASVGVGTPGVVSRETGRIIGAKNTPVGGMPLGRDVSRRLDRPVRVANDANCFALSEAVDGAAAGAGVVVGLILGTGAGTGLVVDGKLLEGFNGCAGEWGHNPLPWARDDELADARCYCGKLGCLELFVSGPGVVRDHQRATGEALKPKEIFARARAGEASASATVERFHDRLARSIATLINVI